MCVCVFLFLFLFFYIFIKVYMPQIFFFLSLNILGYQALEISLSALKLVIVASRMCVSVGRGKATVSVVLLSKYISHPPLIDYEEVSRDIPMAYSVSQIICIM